MTIPALLPVARPDPALTPLIVQSLPPENRMFLPEDRVSRLSDELGIAQERLLIELLPVAARFARPEISGYQVGAVGRSQDGAVFLGCNLEFGGMTLAETVHAEQFVVANAVQQGARKPTRRPGGQAFPAPYTGSPAGVALRTRGGFSFSGSYLENAAFNPSLSAFQAALVGLVGAGIPFGEIEAVVVAETDASGRRELRHSLMMVSGMAAGASVRELKIGF